MECSLDWTFALTEKRPVDIVYLYYAKAFDSVVRNRLLYKLACYVICDMLLVCLAAHIL